MERSVEEVKEVGRGGKNYTKIKVETRCVDFMGLDACFCASFGRNCKKVNGFTCFSSGKYSGLQDGNGIFVF